MTTPNGDVDFAAEERLREEQQATDEQSAAEEQPAAERAEEQPAVEEQPAAEEQPAVEAADESAEEEQDPAVALKADLATRPGEWYVVHSYAGYENKVKANLETRVQNLDVGDYIFQVEVPTEEVTEIKNGQRKQVNRKVLPGYILVRMDLTDDSWSTVRNRPELPASSAPPRIRRRCR